MQMKTMFLLQIVFEKEVNSPMKGNVEKQPTKKKV
jgi:hypothetical protein